jgi:hypothetical protein
MAFPIQMEITVMTESKPITDCYYTISKNVLLNGTDHLLYIHISDTANKSYVIL